MSPFRRNHKAGIGPLTPFVESHGAERSLFWQSSPDILQSREESAGKQWLDLKIGLGGEGSEGLDMHTSPGITNAPSRKQLLAESPGVSLMTGYQEAEGEGQKEGSKLEVEKDWGIRVESGKVLLVMESLITAGSHVECAR